VLARPTKCRRWLNFGCRAPQYIGFADRAMTSSVLALDFDTLTLSPMPAVRQLSRSLAIAFAVDRWRPFLRHLSLWRHTHPYLALYSPSESLGSCCAETIDSPAERPTAIAAKSCALSEWPRELGPGPVLVAPSSRCIRSLRAAAFKLVPSSPEAWRPVRTLSDGLTAYFQIAPGVRVRAVPRGIQRLKGSARQGTSLLFSNISNC